MAQDFAAMTANSVDSLLALLGDTDAPAQAVAPMVRLNGTLVMRQSA
jgi:hypothetical protein